MAEEEDKQEEKFDFTAEGEALGYITLAQARLLAMQIARETPGNYGSEYDNVSMVFMVTESGQEEDYYTVILSFRPEIGFTGRQGQEQFFITKEGEVVLRQVLGPPRTKGRRPRLIVIAGVALVIAAVALGASSIFGSGPFGASPSLPPTTVAGGGRDSVPVAAAAPASTPIPVVVIPTATRLPTSTPTPQPRFGQYYQGRTLTVSVVSIDRIDELLYSSGLPGQQRRHLRLTASEDGLELIVVHLKVENHTATSVTLNVDRTGAELRDFLSNRYFPIDVAERVQDTNRSLSPTSRSARVLNLQADGTFTPGQGFISGPFELARDMGIEGWIIFEAPKEAKFREFKWRAGDSLTIKF